MLFGVLLLSCSCEFCQAYSAQGTSDDNKASPHKIYLIAGKAVRKTSRTPAVMSLTEDCKRTMRIILTDELLQLQVPEEDNRLFKTLCTDSVLVVESHQVPKLWDQDPPEVLEDALMARRLSDAGHCSEISGPNPEAQREADEAAKVPPDKRGL
jgi:hypothetical protein